MNLTDCSVVYDDNDYICNLIHEQKYQNTKLYKTMNSALNFEIVGKWHIRSYFIFKYFI